MTFYLSCEAYSAAAGLLMRYHQLTELQLRATSDLNYGQELTEIAIITICVPDFLYEDGGWRERKLFLKKTHSADLRLRLNYQEFLSATPEHRSHLYCKHILDSIETLRKKVSRHFRFDDLFNDISILLNDPIFRAKLSAIRRLP